MGSPPPRPLHTQLGQRLQGSGAVGVDWSPGPASVGVEGGRGWVEWGDLRPPPSPSPGKRQRMGRGALACLAVVAVRAGSSSGVWGQQCSQRGFYLVLGGDGNKK